MMGTTKQRTERLEQIPQIIKENGGRMKFRELFGKVTVPWGIRDNTLWDYLDSLKAAGLIRWERPLIMNWNFDEGTIMIRLPGVPEMTPEEETKQKELRTTWDNARINEAKS